MKKTNTIPVWLTYHSAGSLHSRGLQQVSVWYTKPCFVYYKDTGDWENEDLPFGDSHQRQGCQEYGWLVLQNDKYAVNQSNSFGKIFGYESLAAQYVWNELCKHFKSDNLRDWMKQEKSKVALPENFLLEMNIEIKIPSL